MDLEDIMLSKLSVTGQLLNVSSFHLYEASKIVKVIEVDNRAVIIMGWE